MPTLVEQLTLSGNPFEHYTAETEPHITEYAVRPPYLEAIAARVTGLSSFILFGDRGAGKSATRITVFNQVWAPGQQAGKEPLVVNFTDFQSILPLLKRGALADSDIIEAVAFAVVEQLLLWLATLADGDRDVTMGVLTPAEQGLCHQLVSEFYFSRPEFERQFSSEEAYKLLNSALTTKSAIWISQRWDSIAAVLASIASVLSKSSSDGDVDAGPAAHSLLKALRGAEANSGRAVLSRLVQLAKIFGFTGVAVLVDKVDETELTTNSAEATSKLIYPLISHIQLLEVSGFSWQFFLWSKVKGFFEGEGHSVRLDKIANSLITWTPDEFRLMLDKRINYFSGGREAGFVSLFAKSDEVQHAFTTICQMAMGSPRELVKIMDVIVREHDSNFAVSSSILLTTSSIEVGLDKYVKEVIGTVFSERSLGQIYRMKKTRFVNRDVQSAFRVGDQSARAKIKAWEDAGLVRFLGTRAAEGDLGGKPSNEYVIADARIERIMNRELVTIEEEEIGEESAIPE